MDHFFQSLEGWFDEADKRIYDIAVDKFNSGSSFVEIGCYKGKSSCAMAVNIINSAKDIAFYCVDTWKGSPEHQLGEIWEDENVVQDNLYDVFRKNINPVKKYITPIRKSSLEAAKDFEDGSLEFIFLDADHSYEAVKNDLCAWYPKLKSNGMMSGHDWKWDSVSDAVIDFAAEVKMDVFFDVNVWHFYKGE